ncbi:MAG: hypothetical protein NZ894_05945 [Archaeoglobaceae archaeon]|nr:hypothetical protein [Archaeoglobaceae archaeon]
MARLRQKIIIFELEDTFWKVVDGKRIKYYSDLDRALLELKKDLTKLNR